MRPYQIAATESILRRIATSTNHRQLGTAQAGGFIWHTTGSGKTLTSFKTAQLASALPNIEKVLFVVDRKDLDYQTMLEYDRFEKGAANSNKSTSILQKQLEDANARIIITTIQKLSNFVDRNKRHPIFEKHVVVIFDECHRSQFGDMHAEITKSFNAYNLFGFTGTPIFAANAGTAGDPSRRTTEQAFGDKLHTYTIVDAINDQNVLPFRIDYIKTIEVAKGLKDQEVSAIDTEAALLAPERIRKIVAYVLEHFDQKTRRGTLYRLDNGKRRSGFNSIFACASIESAKRFYSEFSAQQASKPNNQKLKIAMIYTYSANEESQDGIIDDDGLDVDNLDGSAREALEASIKSYNSMFATNYDTSAERFQNYYKDVSMRLKSGDLDMVVVVNMFLTGFDAATLNTLWVDKNLKAHGLIQAFSRTNRILNSVKTYGNIVSFRNLEQQTNDALSLFGNKDAQGIVLLKPYQEYHDEYNKLTEDLLSRFPVGGEIVGEKAKKEFVQVFGAILRLRNILHSFDEFDPYGAISARDMQDYQSEYLNLHAESKARNDSEKESILDGITFEIELIKQVEINVDYILELVRQLLKTKGGEKNKEVRADISRAIASSPALRNKKDLVEQFVESVSHSSDVGAQWSAFMSQQKEKQLSEIIQSEGLNAEETRRLIEDAFRDGAIPTSGTAITKCLPPAPRFGQNANHAMKKQTVIEKLSLFFERFVGI
jgi:type I restriction enzyme R subunit